MIKRTILAACVAAFAFAALPALAMAEPETKNPGDPFLEGAKEGTKFTAVGGEAKLTGSIGTIKCKKNSGSGEFFDPETGSFTQKFEECTGPLGVTCTGTKPVSSSGTITTTTLPFHLKKVVHEGAEKPGILITPGPDSLSHGKHFASFSCPLAGEIAVGGNGLVGTIVEPEEGVASNTAKLVFGSTEPGSTTQTHRKVAGDATEYDLKAAVGGGETKTAAEDAEGVITFAEGMKPILKTTPLG